MVYTLIYTNACYRSTVNDTELDLTNLTADVHSFVQQYRKGHRDTKELIFREAVETRMHVSTTIQGTNEALERVGQDLGKLALNVDVKVDQARREHLLQSLKYPGFNERRNEVREAHTDTFQWVFAGDGDESAEPGSKMTTTKWDSFSNWLKSTDTVYWISGKPGSGKSTLVKYILADPQVQQCLDIWSPGCLLISHYLWRPGSPMQRSIKGLFCSLLFQLLENSGKALEGVLESAAGSDMKGEVTDWSLEELQSTVLSTMEAYDLPICMFLDGLDELYPEQPTTLLDMIKKLSMAGETKMCLASRPEPPLQRRLYNMPQLRLQDLTASDLKRYVYDNIHASNFEDLDRYETFAISLVWRAEGVFLWLVLVTKSVRNGFDNGDSVEIIEERVDCLKDGDLESLYKDMWDRASKDNPDAYRRTAALYFRIMLLYNHERSFRQQIYCYNLSVFTMMLASTEFAEKTLDAAPQPFNLVPEETLLQSCKEVERIAEIYCFGLIEVFHEATNYRIKETVGWYKGKYDKLLVYAQGQRALVFIHRTARDFLTDTAQGQEILSYDDTTKCAHAIRLVVANLAHAQLFRDFHQVPGLGGSLASSHLRSNGSVRQAYTEAERSSAADYTRMMTHCKRLCDSEKLFANLTHDQFCVCSGVDFFKAVAMHNCRCMDIFEDQIKALDKETLSELLLILCDSFDMGCLRYVNLLLLEGADPNWHGTTAFAGSAIPSTPYTCRRTPFVALLSQTLKKAQKDNKLAAVHASGTKLSWNDSTELLVTLQTFVRCEANLDAKVAIFFKTGVPSNAETPNNCQALEYRPLCPIDLVFYERKRSLQSRYGYVCSFPAHHVLNLLLSTWETLRRHSNQERPFADLASAVANHSICRPTSMNHIDLRRMEVSPGLIFGFPGRNSRVPRKSRWFFASREHQGQIEEEVRSLIEFSERYVDTSGYETLDSMLGGLHWVETGSGTGESVLKHLVEIGVFAIDSNPRELHTVEEENGDSQG